MKYTLALLAVALTTFTSALPHPIGHPEVSAAHYNSADLYGRGFGETLSMENRDAVVEERGMKSGASASPPSSSSGKSSDMSMHGDGHGKDGHDKGSMHGGMGMGGKDNQAKAAPMHQGGMDGKDGQAKAAPAPQKSDSKSSGGSMNGGHHHKGGMV